MSLTDPTSGVGYAFGERLSSAHMTTLATQQPRALDATSGGTYAPTALIRLNSGSGGNVELGTGFSFKWAGTGSSDLPQLGARTIARTIVVAPFANASSRWSYDFVRQLWVQSDITSAGQLVIPFTPQIDRATLDRVEVIVDGNGGGTGHGALPAVMPTAQLWFNTTAAAATSVGSGTDGSASVAAYEVAHAVVIGPGLAHQILHSNGRNYFLTVTGEAGANSVANALALCQITAHYIVTEVTPGG